MHFDRGLSALAMHRPADAVKALQRALENCPASRSRDLYKVCLFLGIALQRVGYTQSAIRSWTACQRLNKRGHTRKMLARYTNCYGMQRQASSEADDWQAFYSIQAARYLLGKNKRTFSTAAEQDMIGDLIRDTWLGLAGSPLLAGTTGCQRMEAFKSVRIVFPTIVVGESRLDDPVISVNFQTKRRVALSDRCACGSGLTHLQCCGRTLGKEELLSGLF